MLFRSHVQQVDEEVVAQHAGPVGELAVAFGPGLYAQHPQAAHQHGHLRRAQGQQLRFVQQQFGCHALQPRQDVVAETVGSGQALRREGKMP